MATRTSQSVNEGWSQNKTRTPAVFYDQHKDSVYQYPPGHPKAGEKPFLNGRPWWGYVERSADGASMPMPVGPLTPMEWTAPWFPDDKYITGSIGRVRSDGSIIMGMGILEQRFRIDYVLMKTDYTQAMQDYYRKVSLAAQSTKERGPDYGGPVSYQLRQLVGNPPKSPKIPEAALAGNKWLLGQLPPVFNNRTQQWEIEEDEQLARLLDSGRIEIATPQQAEGRSERMVEMERELAEIKALLAAKASAPPAVKPLGAYQRFVQEQAALGLTNMKEVNLKWRAQKQALAAG